MDLIYYNGEHSVTIGGKHSWMDWRLIPASKPVIAVPTVKTKTIEVPGAHGMLDLTTMLTGYPLYNNRQGSLQFIVDPGAWRWEEAFSDITTFLGGHIYQMVLDDDPEYYYEGRFWVSATQSDRSTNAITIGYDLHPYKRKPKMTKNFTLSSTPQTFTIDNCNEPIGIELKPTANGAKTITHWEYDMNGKSVGNGSTSFTANSSSTLSIGKWSTASKYVLTMTGTGTLTVQYQEARL